MACPLAALGVGARLQVRGHKPWGRKAAKRAYKLAFLPLRPQRLPPLRAFHLSASRNPKLKDYFVENGVYAILNGVRAQPYSSFLRTWRRRPTPSAARGHAQKKIKKITKLFQNLPFLLSLNHDNTLITWHISCNCYEQSLWRGSVRQFRLGNRLL